MDNAFTKNRFDKGRNYVYQGDYGQPKEYFKRIAEHIKLNGGIPKGAKLLDIGCATGHFFNYLHSHYPDAVYTGMDVDTDCLDVAAKRNPGHFFIHGNLEDKSAAKKDCADIIFALSTTQYFDDLQPVFENLAHWLKPGGTVYLFGSFNPLPVDTLLRFKNEHEPAPAYQTGRNYFSQETVAKTALSFDMDCSFIPFEMPFEIAPDSKDPIRSWTTSLDGEKYFTNGVGLAFKMAIAVCKHKSRGQKQ